MVKIVILPKFVYRCNTIPIRIPGDFLIEMDKLILKFIYNCKGYRMTKTILKMKNKVRGLTLDFKTYYKGTVIKRVWHTHKDKHIGHWNRVEIPEVHPCVSV